MKNSIFQLVLLATICAMSSSCAITDEDDATGESDIFSKPAPEFPDSEYQSGGEGWVVLDYTVGRGGVVEYLHIRDSSGNSHFEDSALDAVRNWRYEPGEEKEHSVLFHFAHRGDEDPVSKEFQSLNQQAHEFIDEGELDRASEIVARARDTENLSLSELAYSHLTEGRIAGKRDDRAKQLRLYRKALLANGRWLAYESYMEALRVAVILELDQGDIASAVRDYRILTSTNKGRRLGADLEDLIEAAKTQLEAAKDQAGGDQSVMQPYVVADNVLTVLPGLPPRYSRAGTRPPRGPYIRPSDNRRPSSRSGGRTRGGASKKD